MFFCALIIRNYTIINVLFRPSPEAFAYYGVYND